MAAMKPRTGDGPLEVTKEGRGIVLRMPLEGGGVDDLVGALVAEVGAADHQDDLDQRGRHRAEQDRGRQDEDELVAKRSDGDPLDDGQFAFSRQSVDVAGGDRGVVLHGLDDPVLLRH